MASESVDALDARARSVLKIIFVTLFLDLIGFSIIFPLFPSLLTHYMEVEGGEGLIGAIVGALQRITESAGGPTSIGVIVLFGGVLSSVYSLLQFIFSPIIGHLSDRFGRRPILLVSIAGIAISYLIWIFAGRFYLLILARILGGIMAANISTASAVVADITSPRNRAKGMAIIGMAFGLGFIIGPALGGFAAEVNLLERWPGLASYGINPFSVPAAIALLLSLANLLFVATRFTETLPKRRDDKQYVTRSINPLKLFETREYPGVAKTALTNFVFLSSFAGMEFALTFLAMDRLDYGPRENAYMFVFIGLTIALVQGGYVRRRSTVIGPQRMALHGFLCTIPGMFVVAIAGSSGMLYLGLFLMAVGSAQIIPCLTALASIYAPPEEQGRMLGVFRSLGALARAIGPLVACVAYWQLGSRNAYFLGAASLVIPLLMAATLPKSEVE